MRKILLDVHKETIHELSDIFKELEEKPKHTRKGSRVGMLAFGIIGILFLLGASSYVAREELPTTKGILRPLLDNIGKIYDPPEESTIVAWGAAITIVILGSLMVVMNYCNNRKKLNNVLKFLKVDLQLTRKILREQDELRGRLQGLP